MTRLAIAALLLATALTGVLVAHARPDLAARVTAAAVAPGAGGWMAALLLQVLIAMVGVLPASAGAIACGLAYGTARGFALSGVATLAGALMAFELARGLFRPAAERFFARRPRFARLDGVLAAQGWRGVVLLRLSPVMPFAITSYALALTSISRRAYLLGSCASLPALLGYVAMGALARSELSAGRAAGVLHHALVALAAVSTLVLIVVSARVARRVLVAPEIGA